ncbi:Two-component response regulator-like APRR1 [Vitis vinifera]|uniref:Two-component response regulator-like APRR1 n=1 Tax=Vitis vinifera TaxID=29760 RepID=A0A438BUN2_VITVI|nr:Two-component response regulator-like APRR1 [Vitis vinifera]
MPTTANGDITIYATETYWKDSSHITQRPIFSRFDAAELDTLFIPGILVDASFALDSYNHQLNVGIFRQSGIEMQLGLCMRLIRKHQCRHSYGFCLLEPKFGGEGERETKGEGLLIKLTATKGAEKVTGPPHALLRPSPLHDGSCHYFLHMLASKSTPSYDRPKVDHVSILKRIKINCQLTWIFNKEWVAFPWVMNSCEAFFSLKQFGTLCWNCSGQRPAKSDASGNGNTNKRICAFVNRIKLKILLCDANVNNCREVATLLRGCSYQVTSVGSTREVIYVLNCEGASIDIVLAEADLPMANSMKILKYITQDQELRCIPVMRQHLHDRKVLDAWSDYLMMPLGSNVLFNLWTHVWRTRRMLGLPEKNSFIVTLKDSWHPPSMLEMLLEKGSFYKMRRPHPLNKNFKVPIKSWRILVGQSSILR